MLVTTSIVGTTTNTSLLEESQSMDSLSVSPVNTVKNPDFDGLLQLAQGNASTTSMLRLWPTLSIEGTYSPGQEMAVDPSFDPLYLSQNNTEQAINNPHSIQLGSTNDNNAFLSTTSDSVRLMWSIYIVQKLIDNR
jgi:hypothetical protein